MESKQELKIAFGTINEKNLDLVRTLNLHTFPVQYNPMFYTALISYDKYTRLAYFNDILVGAICCREEYKDSVKTLYILTFGVLKPYRRYKIGSQLIDEILESAKKDKEIKYVYLHIQVGNNSALEFYKKYGFEIAETLVNYYQDIQPADCYILKKLL